MPKSPAEKLAKAQAKAAKRERQARLARQAVGEARKGVLPAVQAGRPPQIPQPGPWEDHLFSGALDGDQQAIDLLHKSGFWNYYTSELEHIIATSTIPGYKAWAAGMLAKLDPQFDALGPLPRSPR